MKLQKALWRKRITQGFENCSVVYNHGDSCYGNRSEEVAGDGATVNMKMSLMKQSEDDDHSGGQEEKKSSYWVVLCDVIYECCYGDNSLPR